MVMLSGFLVAGKTTFLRELLERLPSHHLTADVIRNDFLNAAIHANTLKGLGAEIKGLAAGCVCCDETGRLIDAILRVPTAINPIIIIEANGTTDPYRLIETLTLTGVLRDRLGPIIQVTIINESRWGKRLFPGDKRTERAQASTASAILTNHSDRATDKQKRKLRDLLMELNPSAPLLDIDTFVELLLRETAEAHLPTPDISQPIPHIHHHAAVHLTPPTMTE
jgi:G3E family GTPase